MTEHQDLARKAAATIEAYLSEYQAEFRTRVYGNPPTISLQVMCTMSARGALTGNRYHGDLQVRGYGTSDS